MDATQAFPFPNASFDYVFSEHMIEHVSYDAGVRMLIESFRVLRPGGKVRISTPPLEFLIDTWMAERNGTLTAAQQQCIDYNMRRKGNGVMEHPNACFLLNYFMRMDYPDPRGHIFLYDDRTLRVAMTTAGFVNIEPFRIKESRDSHLQGLEKDERLPAGMLQLNTFTLEGTKPVSA